jgi:hypothetical protein
MNPVDTPAPDDYSLEQWDYLTSIIQQECNFGPTGPGSGSNMTGRLQLIYSVEKSIHISSGQYPAIGIQLVDANEQEYATHFHMLFCTFRIVIAAVDRGNPIGMNPTPASLTQAMANLRPNISDGMGNGLGPILRDKNNYTLGGNAIKTGIKSTTYDWMFAAGPGSAALAYALIEYRTQQKISITN